MLKEGAPTIQIGYDKLPSRYPPGYPLLMIPWLRFFLTTEFSLHLEQTKQSGLLLLIGSFSVLFCDWKAARWRISSRVARDSTSIR